MATRRGHSLHVQERHSALPSGSSQADVWDYLAMDACAAERDASCSLARFADLGERVLVWMDGSLQFAVIAVIAVQYDTNG